MFLFILFYFGISNLGLHGKGINLNLLCLIDLLLYDERELAKDAKMIRASECENIS